jgi:uncharacterized protein (DUF362 family)
MQPPDLSRRELLFTAAAAVSGSLASAKAAPRPVVSIVRIRHDKTAAAVENAIDLLGGVKHFAGDRETVLLKPNLVSSDPKATTKIEVIRALAGLMKRAGKEVSIGEGSAAAPNFNVLNGQTFRTRKREILEPMQQYVFEQLGYAELARGLRIPLINLHCGDLLEVSVPGAFVFDKITLHRSLTQTDLLCSVPMMKTHQLATVTLGMKNLVGTFPGTVYQSIRGHMHDVSAKVEPTAASAVVVDLVRANKPGLVVIDGSMAMEGNGPSMGKLVKMDVIIAGTNPVATDMVAAALMGFEPRDVPVFAWASKAGMRPQSLGEIEVRGEPIQRVARQFARPQVYAWNAIRPYWGAQEI